MADDDSAADAAAAALNGRPIPKPSRPSAAHLSSPWRPVSADGPHVGGSHIPFPISGGTVDNHADGGLEATADVAPPLHPSTTFLQSSPLSSPAQIYSRADNITRQRVEAVLGRYEGGQAVTYSSGLAAASALVHAVKPRRIYSESGYHGVTAVLAFWKERQVGGGDAVEFVTEEEMKTLYAGPGPDHGLQQLPDSAWSRQEGQQQEQQSADEERKEVAASPTRRRVLDLIWLEAPNNPFATLADIAWFAVIARKTGALLAVDSTLSSPLGMQPLQHGADCVMHASTKYLSGHSDLLGGVLTTPHPRLHRQLMRERIIDGAVMGTLECWLLLRSLRTLSLRVRKQCGSVMQVVHWLEQRRVKGDGKLVAVHHPCLPTHPSFPLSARYLLLPPATFAIELRGGEAEAKRFASSLFIFQQATSLGGVESLIDWRYQYDHSVSQSLLRVSIGVEEPEDLIADLQQALDRL